ncbi:MAG: hypothetical protein ACYC7A_10995 [Thermoanaerobaculia bacterium]
MSSILDFFLLITLLAAPIQPVKAPDSLRVPGAYEPFWVSVSYAVDASGNVRAAGLDDATTRILESAKAESRREAHVNTVGPCETIMIRPFHSPTERPYRSLSDLLEYAPTIYIGRIARMDSGFSSGMPSTLIAIEISQTPRSTPEFATSGIVFVEWRGADFEVFGKRFCNMSAFDTYSPAIGDTVILFPYGRPVDSGRRFLYTAQEQLLAVRDGVLHASRGLVDRSNFRTPIAGYGRDGSRCKRRLTVRNRR